jgi:glutaredoxin
MNQHHSLRLSRSILLIGALIAGGGCKKQVSQPATGPGAAATKPPAAGGSLPAGIDLGKLGDFERKLFDRVIDREPSACGKGHSLRHSVTHDSACRASFYAVRYVARLAGSGSSEPEIIEKVEQRFRAPRVPYIDLAEAPSKGSTSGRVKLAEFVDYQCDHCKHAQTLMPPLLAAYPDDLTVYFKHFPLGGHVASLNAAMGATAAQKQGKFWPFNEKVWENSEQLSPALLESMAKDLGLDFARWYADVGSEEVRAHVLRDRTEGRTLEIRNTPAIFINGRRYTDALDLPSLKDWIDEELGR